MALNKQPIFTATPLLITDQFDPKIPTTLKNPGMDSYTTIYTDGSTYGSLITKVTVVATGLIGDRVTTKIIYLGIEGVNSGYVSLYQSKVMTGIGTLTATDIVPYVTFTFDGGLVMDPLNGYRLYIAASTNANATGESGDEISVIVEGGTYEQPA
jgi:hypothetical protein